MDWKHASSLLISVFLIMNICLGLIYYGKVQQSRKIDVGYEKSLSFSEEHIQLPKTLPAADNVKMSYVSGKSKNFMTAEKVTKKSTISEKTLSSPITLETVEASAIIEALKPYLATEPFKGKQYILSGIDRKHRKIYFEQTFENYPILSNETAQIIFEYDKNKKVNSYQQTYLEDLQIGLGKNNEKKQVVKPRQALETLYYQNVLKSGDTVSAVRLGYYSVGPNIEGQVLKPTWQVAIIHQDNTRETFYVDALKPEETILK